MPSCYRDPTFDQAYANLEREKREVLAMSAKLIRDAQKKADPEHIRMMQRKRDRQLMAAMKRAGRL